MKQPYYLDTCIWRDHYENRFGPAGRPLGDLASKVFMKIMKEKQTLFYSDFVARELKKDYGEKDINDMFNVLFLSGILKRVDIEEKHFKEAKKLSAEKKVPLGDALHAILARDHNAILITQDWKDFSKLTDVVDVKKPEDIL